MAVITFNKIDFSAADLATATGRGAEQWHDRNDVNIPQEGSNTQRTDVYYRFTPMRFCTNTKGQYNWNWIDARFNDAISKRQKFSFRLMTLYPEGTDEHGLVNFDGGWSGYPLWLHQTMKGQWKKGSSWVQNWNDPAYLAWELEMKTALAQHIIDKGWQKVVGYVDIAFGSWGEFHLVNIVNDVNELPAAIRPTVAAYKSIIDSNLKAFPNYPAVVCFAGFDGNRLTHTRVPADVGYYLLTAKNNFGPIGWRRDNLGITDEYTVFYTKTNNISFNGLVFKDAIMPRHKTSPVVGEPPGWSITYNNLESQIREYHFTSFGNGNYGGANTNSQNRNYIRAASKAAGYRILVEIADVTFSGKIVTAKISWKNEGITPPYFEWDIVFDVVKGSSVVASAKSAFKLKLFQPAGVATIAVDNLPFDVADGTYELRFKVVDPTGYMKPMPLYVQNPAGTDGSYSLGNVNLSGGVIPPPVNKPPVVSAGPDREIIWPVKTTTLVGTASDTDGTIKSSVWSLVSGPADPVIVTPNLLTTTVNFTKDGVYIFRLIGTDDKGATSVDEMIVRVNPEIVVPPTTKTVKDVTTVSMVTTKSTVIYSDGSKEEFPKV